MKYVCVGIVQTIMYWLDNEGTGMFEKRKERIQKELGMQGKIEKKYSRKLCDENKMSDRIYGSQINCLNDMKSQFQNKIRYCMIDRD